MRSKVLFSVGFVAATAIAACSSSKSSSSNDNGNGSDGGPGNTTGEGGNPGSDTDGSSPDNNPPGNPTPCSVASKGTAGVNLSGRVLLPTGAITGEVFIDSTGKIACAAASCSATTGYAAATQIACPGAVISPGLINMHDHTDYNTAAPIQVGTQRWDHRNGWRTGTGGEPKLTEPQTSSDAKVIAAAELRFLMSGTTSLVGSGGVGGFVRNLANYQTPAELEGLTGKTVFFDTFPLGDSNGTELTSGCAYPSVRTASTAFEDGIYAPHVAEGVNAAAENEFTCEKATLITSKTSVLHGVGLTAADINTIAADKASLVWAPRSNIVLYGNTASITVFKTFGVNIALGTDWLASGSMNMLRELNCADSVNQKYFNGALSDADLWNAATHNGGVASGFSGQIGDLIVGAQGDVAIYDGESGADYRAVIAGGVEDVHLVLRGGKAMYGDTDLVTALSATACDPLTVCTQAKSVCVDVTGVTMADIQTAATESYPLYFCKTAAPTGEPSCVPYRDTYPDGTSATDHDGDGVPDATDNCPDVFNPARPMDGTAQPDADADGAGDACDAAPLDATKK